MNRPADLFSIPVSLCDVTGDGASGTVDRQGGSVNTLPSVCTNWSNEVRVSGRSFR